MENNRKQQKTQQEIEARIAANDREMVAINEKNARLRELLRAARQLNYRPAVDRAQNTGTNAEATKKDVAREDRSTDTSQDKEAAGEDGVMDGAP